MIDTLKMINGFVWGVPALLLILLAGIVLTKDSNFLQLRLFPTAIRAFVGKLTVRNKEKLGVSSFQSLCTALAATVGTGNIAGVSGALCIGGPGAVFWLWISALLGMIIKFAEATLCVHYQKESADGVLHGGAMHMIEQGLGKRFRWLGCLYCAFGVIAAFGVGNATQVNAVVAGINEAVGWNACRIRDAAIGAALALLAAIVLMGGAKRIGSFTEKLIPLAAVGYILLGLGIIFSNFAALPAVMRQIFLGAFSPRAVTGGMVGSAFITLRIGVSRGVFTNEAGMGTAGMAYAGAKASHPVELGLMGIVEVFVDTIVICTITALAILCSGVPLPYGKDCGAVLTSKAFASVYGGVGSGLLALFVCLFAFATMIGWGLYGIRCAQYLLGERVWKPFVVMQTVAVAAAAALGTETVWLFAETVNGLMAIPNLIAILALRPALMVLVKEYSNISGVSAIGGTYESFDQCESVRAFSHEKVPPAGGGSRAPGKKDLPFEYRSA
jgi:AGCS family alanine or glycine:cation symporter